MIEISRPDNYRPFKPAWASPCLCGSGKKFRNCCRKRLPGTSIGDAWRTAAAEGNWHAALLHGRADITQYTIWHRSHTDPIHLGLVGNKGGQLFLVDIEALSAHLGDLCFCYNQLGQLHKLPVVLDRLRVNINDQRWLGKIAYHKAICAMVQGDRAEAAISLEEAGQITPQTNDVDLLQAHIDLHGHQMGLSEKLTYFDAVVANTTTIADKLQYMGAKAFALIASTDTDGARKVFVETIDIGRKEEKKTDFSVRAEHWFCKNLEGLAVIDKDAGLFREVAERLAKLSENESLSTKGQAMVLQMLGDCHRYEGSPKAALDAYNRSLELSYDEITQIFLAECLWRVGEADRAFENLSNIDRAALDDEGELDFAFTAFFVAKARRNLSEVIEARQELLRLSSPDPYFEKLRLEYVINASQTIEALRAGDPVPDTGAFIDALRTLSRYAQLQPNLFGLGVNINNMIDDVVAAAEERAANRTKPSSG